MSLECPSCGRAALSDEERFCATCGTPLVVAGAPAQAEVSEAAQRARKINRRYSEGDLVSVAVSRNLPDAELMQNLLLEEGIPSVLRRSLGFDVPEMVFAGPRNVLVPRSGEEAAREVLSAGEPPDRPARQPLAVRVVAWTLLAIVASSFAAALLRLLLEAV